MINKNFDLLGEQLAESGLEMSVDPFTGAMMGISAVSSIFGGIFGASQADKANRAQQKAYKEQQKAAEEAAELQNEYNEKKFEVDKENYYKNTEYNYQTAVQQWQYNNNIRAFEEKQNARKFLRDAERISSQLTYNKYAFDTGVDRIQTGLNEQRVADSFERQESLIESLNAQGAAQTMQAGKSSLRTTQTLLAKLGRDIAVMDANRKSAIDAANSQLLELGYNKIVGDRNVALSAMLRPESLPDIPAPQRPPEPTWLEPMKILPQYVSAPIPQSVVAPIVQGIGQAAGSLSNMDWNVKQTATNDWRAGLASMDLSGVMFNP
jgi:hypothetical protein